MIINFINIYYYYDDIIIIIITIIKSYKNSYKIIY